VKENFVIFLNLAQVDVFASLRERERESFMGSQKISEKN
jgi:hypothetical protein